MLPGGVMGAVMMVFCGDRFCNSECIKSTWLILICGSKNSQRKMIIIINNGLLIFKENNYEKRENKVACAIFAFLNPLINELIIQQLIK